MALTIGLAAASMLTFGLAAASAAGGVRLETWSNAVMAGTPASTTTSEALAGQWPRTHGAMSALFTGSITPHTSGMYAFNCTFGGDSYGLGWVDGHILCTHGMPLYAGNVGFRALNLTAGVAVSVRLQLLKNTSSAADVASELRWRKLEGDGEAGGSGAEPMSLIPASVLSPHLPSAAQTQMAAIQREQYTTSAGWGSWYAHNLLAVTRLPDGAQLEFGLCQLSSSTCELVSIDSAFGVRLGPHAIDGSFAELHHWWGGGHWDGGVNVSVTWATVPTQDPAGLADIRLLVTPVGCGNCSNYAVVLVMGFSPVWSGAGTATADPTTATMTVSPIGELPTTVFKAAGPSLPMSGAHPNLDSPHLAFAVQPGTGPGGSGVVVLSSVEGEDPAATIAALAVAERAERATYTSYGTETLAELKEAVQASQMWLVVYVPYATGLILTLSRGSMGGGNSQCDWDNFFAAMMLGSDRRGQELGFATFAQELGSKTEHGFVPNGANAAHKSRDRTEPIVGAKVLETFLVRFGVEQTGWVIEWAFDQLFGWHDWAWQNRRLQPVGLIAPGSSPISLDDPSDWGVNSMQGARWETGMDNSPMYDGPDGASDNKSGPVIFDTTDHLMQLFDVGMSANLASDMLALATVGEAWCGAPATTVHTSPCGNATVGRIKLLRQRAAELATLIQDHLWDDNANVFVNKMPAKSYNLSIDTFYPRISPTSFYPLMTGVPTTAQADSMVKTHLLSPTGFCVTPETEWPPAATMPGKEMVLLQSWRLPAENDGGPANVVLCTAAEESDTPTPGSCGAVLPTGASFVRNESYVWTVESSARTALFLFHVADGNQTVVARAGDFPASARVSATPVAWAAAQQPQPGAWPLLLWTAVHPSQSSSANGGPTGNVTYYRTTGGPGSANEVAQATTWTLKCQLGWALPLPTGCYWGLPSVSFDDPAFATPGAFVYWRGNAWAPLAMLTYWSLDNPAYANLTSARVARKGLANSYARMWMETAWRPSRTVCENYCVDKRGGCCGDTFYHWGALAGFMSILEAGK